MTSDLRTSVPKTYKLFIGGQFPRTESGRYYAFGDTAINVCLASRKDARNAVVAARKAVLGWSSANAYLKGQILYRIAEILEGRRRQFVDELVLEGVSEADATNDVDLAIDRLVHYAGWSDKYVQLLSAVNPVASSHFNFSMPEPCGVVAIAAPAGGLLGLVSELAPIIVSGNTTVVLASEAHPLTAISFGEVLQASDVPAGVVNILTGPISETLPHLAGHMDVNGLLLAIDDASVLQESSVAAAENLKRVSIRSGVDYRTADAEGLLSIAAFQETKTTWHPIAR